jgi:hypothetical protein
VQGLARLQADGDLVLAQGIEYRARVMQDNSVSVGRYFLYKDYDLMKQLLDIERKILLVIADALDGEEKEELLYDLSSAYVIERNIEEGISSFEIRDYFRPPYNGQTAYSVEGSMSDRDGADLWVIAYKDQNKRLLELEIIRWDGGEIIEPVEGTFHIGFPKMVGSGGSEA